MARLVLFVQERQANGHTHDGEDEDYGVQDHLCGFPGLVALNLRQPRRHNEVIRSWRALRLGAWIGLIVAVLRGRIGVGSELGRCDSRLPREDR